jgi:hypothetical protein
MANDTNKKQEKRGFLESIGRGIADFGINYRRGVDSGIAATGQILTGLSSAITQRLTWGKPKEWIGRKHQELQNRIAKELQQRHAKTDVLERKFGWGQLSDEESGKQKTRVAARLIGELAGPPIPVPISGVPLAVKVGKGFNALKAAASAKILGGGSKAIKASLNFGAKYLPKLYTPTRVAKARKLLNNTLKGATKLAMVRGKALNTAYWTTALLPTANDILNITTDPATYEKSAWLKYPKMALDGISRAVRTPISEIPWLKDQKWLNRVKDFKLQDLTKLGLQSHIPKVLGVDNIYMAATQGTAPMMSDNKLYALSPWFSPQLHQFLAVKNIMKQVNDTAPDIMSEFLYAYHQPEVAGAILANLYPDRGMELYKELPRKLGEYANNKMMSYYNDPTTSTTDRLTLDALFGRSPEDFVKMRVASMPGLIRGLKPQTTIGEFSRQQALEAARKKRYNAGWR